MYQKFIDKIKNLGGWNSLKHIPQDFWSEKKLQNLILALEEERDGALKLQSKPYHLVIEPTNVCNLRCTLCSSGLGNMSRNKGRMDLDNFKKLIDEVHETTLEIYLQNWGESTLVNYLPEMIKYAADKNVWVHLSTNFSLNYPNDFLDQLMHSGLALLHCDIDGTIQEVYEKYRAGGNLNLVLQNIKKCIAIKILKGLKYPVIEGTMLVMRHNEHQIDSFNQLAEELGLDQWNLGKIQLDPNMDPENKKEWLPQAKEHKYPTYCEGNSMNDPTSDPTMRPKCHWPWSGLVINWDGNVAPCCIVDDQKADFANVFNESSEETDEGSLRKVWNHPKFISARAQFSVPFDSSKIIDPNICNICKNQTHRSDIKRFPNTYSMMLDEEKLPQFVGTFPTKTSPDHLSQSEAGDGKEGEEEKKEKKKKEQAREDTASVFMEEKVKAGKEEDEEVNEKETNKEINQKINQKMNVPWAKLYLDEQEMNEVVDCVKSTWIGKGPRVDQFEEKVKSLIGVKHCIAVNNGTAALDVVLKVLDIKPGDEIIIPAMAYIATANSVLYQHATPIFADINSDTFILDSDDVAKKITAKTKAIIVIDYAGQSADYAKLREIIAGKDISIIEDSAPSFGGEYQAQKLCSLGDLAITSFHVAKSFTAVEGGMVFTDYDNYAEKARIILNQGESSDKKYFHPYLGHNYRLSDLHASIGLVQVNRFEQVIAKRTILADYYTQKLNEKTNLIKTPVVLPGNKHAWFLYPVIIKEGIDRDLVFDRLKEQGISANVSWPMPVYDQPYFQKYLQGKERCPIADDVTKRILCLPMYYAMTEEEQDYVIKNLVEIVRQCRTM